MTRNLRPSVRVRPSFMEVDGLDIAPRSQVASIPPIGLGTRAVESLSSYFMRVADLTSVTPHQFARNLIWPLVGYEWNGNGDDYWQSPSFNGPGKAPMKWAQALTTLTSVRNLDRLTLVPLAGLLPHRELCPSVRRWCPICLEVDAADPSSGTPYDRLLWNINQVDACPAHAIRLVSLCHCTPQEAVSPWRRKFLPHLCWTCGKPLAREVNRTDIEPATAEEVERALMVAALLECPLFLQPADSGRTRSNVAFFLQEAIQAHGTAVGIACLAGVGKSHLSNWSKGRNIPTLPSAIKLAVGCSATLEELLVGTPETQKAASLTTGGPKPRSKRHRNKPPYANDPARKEIVRKSLEAALAVNPPPRLSEVARQLGIVPRVLRMMYSHLVLAITGRYRNWSRRETRKRHLQKRGIIRSAAEHLAHEGTVPTFSKIEKLLGKELSLFGETVRQDCKEICEETISAFGPNFFVN